MIEIRRSFSSIEEWRDFRESLPEIGTINAAVREDVEKYGLVEPMTGAKRLPAEIKINPANLHETISAHELNSRKRALILQICNELGVRNWGNRRDLRILSADGLTRLAMILRARYPFFYGGEYLPTEQAKKEYFPVPHLDLHAIDLPDERFDLFVSGDVFEHLPFLNKALTEIHRVLKPGGVLVSSFPFVPSREATLVRASLSQNGELTHHAPPEYHGNPVGPQAGSLVFQFPGWDILDTLKGIGFSDAYFTLLASSHYGVTSNGLPGPFILTAVKSAPNGPPRRRPHEFSNRLTLPDAVCTLVALPRSGTTLITSVFSVHSKFAAVFEPWNATKEFEKLPPTIDALARRARLPDLGGKMLFVKETAANLNYVANLRKLMEATPDFIPRHVLVVLRSPAQTFISEVSRRSEWWGADVSVNQESFKNWLGKSRVALRQIIRFALQYDGVVIALGAFASNPEKVLETLGERMGFTVERAQLEYEKHVNLKIVHGDRNIGQSPAPIDVAKVNFRDESAKLILPLIADGEDRRWFNAFSDFYELALHAGGVMPASNLPLELRKALLDE